MAYATPAGDASPWYRLPLEHRPPFRVKKLLVSPASSSTSFTVVVSFPWVSTSLADLNMWPGDVVDIALVEQRWKEMVDLCFGSVAVAGGNKLILCAPLRIRWELSVQLLLDEADTITCLSWAVHRDASHRFIPRVLLGTMNAFLYVFDVLTGQVCSCITGHGGGLTSIAVHPRFPHIFCSTSRDFTTRIYDLTQPARTPNESVINLPWPARTIQSRNPNHRKNLSGTPFGQHSTDPEGWGLGRCVAVLAGGRSGGHEAAVMSAAFHDTFPIIATAGMDRNVKIWRIPPFDGPSLGREDKPLFSSSLIHKAAVLSITWLDSDILLTHSANAFVSENGDGENFQEEPGTVVVWWWLGVDRFFPPGPPASQYLRGCASDYQESASFKIISAHLLPQSTKHLRVYHSPYHDPIVVYAVHSSVMLSNVADMSPRPVPAAPQVVMLEEKGGISEEGSDSENGLGNGNMHTKRKVTELTRKTADLPRLTGWNLSRQGSDWNVLSCELCLDGKVIYSVGENENVAVWSF